MAAHPERRLLPNDLSNLHRGRADAERRLQSLDRSLLAASGRLVDSETLLKDQIFIEHGFQIAVPNGASDRFWVAQITSGSKYDMKFGSVEIPPQRSQ